MWLIWCDFSWHHYRHHTVYGYTMFYGPKLKLQKGLREGPKLKSSEHCVRDELGSSVWLRWQICSWVQDCQYKKSWLIEKRGTTCCKHSKPRATSSLSHKNTECHAGLKSHTYSHAVTQCVVRTHISPAIDTQTGCTHTQAVIIWTQTCFNCVLWHWNVLWLLAGFWFPQTLQHQASLIPASAYHEETRGDRLELLKVFKNL